MPSPQTFIGFLIGVGVYNLPNAKVDEKFAILFDYNLAYVYLGALIISMMTRFINFYPLTLKNAALGDDKAKGNMRANMYLFKVSIDEAAKEPTIYSPVILQDEGAAGMYNRANRSLHHFIENAPGFIMMYALAGFVFPLAAMVCAIGFALGRLLHQWGLLKGIWQAALRPRLSA